MFAVPNGWYLSALRYVCAQAPVNPLAQHANRERVHPFSLPRQFLLLARVYSRTMYLLDYMTRARTEFVKGTSPLVIPINGGRTRYSSLTFVERNACAAPLIWLTCGCNHISSSSYKNYDEPLVANRSEVSYAVL